ncbi:hypothetical protein LTR56_021243 [Elasticomyces elasticus]|nr:hypothetical protein LTR56_021243 [Elasticomyces elasticus]KAK3663573.1 hypothetical protein LTR22_005513 [Elasticomyces elasticus]KAK4923557.1 hypothetical protein LTR49_009270 [Elasticomyces elasticus]KAK5751571.1 hypothetical protein LTS12_018344 [Elasticomyces elasticus]
MHFTTSIAIALAAIGTVAASVVPYERLNKNDSVSTPPVRYRFLLTLTISEQALLIVDLQVGLAATVRDWDAATFKSNVLAHASIGKLYDLPVVMTTSTEIGPNGPLPKEILEMYPEITPVRRPGEINAWDIIDAVHALSARANITEFRAAVKATGKRQVIIAGITTDVCVAFLALALRAEGYHVVVNIEASGAFNLRVAEAAQARMVAAGVQVMNLFSINAELFRDWRSTEPDANAVIPYVDRFLAEESFVVRSHAAAVANGTILGAGELETITVGDGTETS